MPQTTTKQNAFGNIVLERVSSRSSKNYRCLGNEYTQLPFTLSECMSNYYPFGSSLSTRSWSDASRAYRYGFNGKEKDSEIASDNYDFGARIYDARLGRWLSLDPLMKYFSSFSAYNFCLNSPGNYFDSDGMQPNCRPSYYQYRVMYRPYYPEQYNSNVYRSNQRVYSPNGGMSARYRPYYKPPISLVYNRPGYAGGMYTNNQSSLSYLTELFVDLGETFIRIQKQDLLFDVTQKTNSHGIISTTITPFLPQNSPEWIELNKQEKTYQDGLAARKKEYIDQNKPRWDSNYYNSLKTQSERDAYKKQYDQKINVFNQSLSAHLAGIEIQYALANGISPMEKFKQEALKFYNANKTKMCKFSQSSRVQSVIYATPTN
jgi:RHS repeat-associated protein